MMRRDDGTLLGIYEGAEVRAHREGSVVRVQRWRYESGVWVRFGNIPLTAEMLAVLVTMAPKEGRPDGIYHTCMDCGGVTMTWTGQPGSHPSGDDMDAGAPCCHDESAGWYWCRGSRSLLARDKVCR